MNLQQLFQQYFKNQFAHIVAADTHLILAVSGGADSVVLTDIIHQAGCTFDIAHCNFQLRGEESNRDEAFVQSLGEKYGVAVQVKHFDTQTYADAHKLGIQEAARLLRYEWFDALLKAHTSRNTYLVTAHHADDNVETVLFNIFRGTGISGLHGILPLQGKLLRPLLFAKREEIIAYARQQQLPWVEDSSNESTKYTRNYIRHEVLPVLKQVFPGVTDNISKCIERWREAEQLYAQAMQVHRKKLCTVKGNEVHIPVLKLQQHAPLRTIVYELTKDVGFTPAQADEVIGLLNSISGKYVSSATHRVIRNRQWLIIAPIESAAAENILIESTDTTVSFGGGTLQLMHTDDATPSSIPNMATLNAAGIKFPLLLRKWKQGDYFYPLGMPKKKKISRFLVDQKVSKTDKEKVWVIESNKKILWVIGYRIDDRFKISPATQKVLRLTFQT